MPTIADLITTARIYVDDNHKVTDGWKTPDDWLKIAKPEVIMCYRKFIRESIVSLSSVDINFTGPLVAFQDDVSVPMVIIGVAQNMGTGRFRVLRPAQSALGRSPFWNTNLSNINGATYWTASMNYFPGSGDPDAVGQSFQGQYVVQVHPPDAQTYTVRYIPEPVTSSLLNNVRLPTGLDDYVSLRIARKALATEGASSQAIDKLIAIAEAEWKMLSFGAVSGDAPRVRICPPQNRLTNYNFQWEDNPYMWYYF